MIRSPWVGVRRGHSWWLRLRALVTAVVGMPKRWMELLDDRFDAHRCSSKFSRSRNSRIFSGGSGEDPAGSGEGGRGVSQRRRKPQPTGAPGRVPRRLPDRRAVRDPADRAACRNRAAGTPAASGAGGGRACRRRRPSGKSRCSKPCSSSDWA